MLSPLIKFCDLESSPGREWETPLQSEISFVNVNIPYGKLTFPWFSAQNDPYAKEGHLGVAYSTALQMQKTNNGNLMGSKSM